MMRFLIALIALLPAVGWAADHTIGTGTGTVNCSTLGVVGGDTITLTGGARGKLVFTNCNDGGDPYSPRVTVRNNPASSAPVQVSGSSGFIVDVQSAHGVDFDFTGGWSGMDSGAYCGAPAGRNGCGFEITLTGSATSVFKIRGSSSDFSVKGVRVKGTHPVTGFVSGGIDLNDHTCCDGQWPTTWRENITFSQNYVHDHPGGGFYIGPNWLQGGSDDLRLRNIEMSYNLVERVGNWGMQLKSAVSGSNRIFGNVVDTTGLRDIESQFRGGIQCFEGACEIFGNRVRNAGNQGIQVATSNIPTSEVAGPLASDVYNNDVLGAGAACCNGPGITVASSGKGAGYTLIAPTLRFNSVVGSAGAGLSVNSATPAGGVEVRSNISVGNTGADITTPGGSTVATNLTGAASSVGFVNLGAGNLRLNSDSVAVDAGGATNVPSTDFEGISRPQGAAADQGAYEFVTSGGGEPGGEEPLPGITTSKPNCGNFSVSTLIDALWIPCEGSGTSIADEVGTDDLTTACDWAVDATHGTVLDCVAANQDYAEVGLQSFTGVVTFDLAVLVSGSPTSGAQLMSLADADVNDRIASLQLQADGTVQLVCRFNDFPGDVNTTSWNLNDGKWHYVQAIVSDTRCDLRVDDNELDTMTISKSGMVASFDSVAFAAKRTATPAGWATIQIAGASVDNSALGSAWNGGDVWTAWGLTAGAGQIPPQRGSQSYARGIIQ